MEAEIAGFGMFGANEDMELSVPRRVHVGCTFVIHGEWMGRTGFLHGSSLSGRALDAVVARRLGRSEANLLQFMIRDHEGVSYDPLDRPNEPKAAKPLHLQKTHPDQAVVTLGDSGGPLFFRDAGTNHLRLAGIASTFETTFLVDQPCSRGMKARLDSRFCAVEVWEPIMDHVAWIRGILERTKGVKARMFDLAGVSVPERPPVTECPTFETP